MASALLRIWATSGCKEASERTEKSPARAKLAAQTAAWLPGEYHNQADEPASTGEYPPDGTRGMETFYIYRGK